MIEDVARSVGPAREVRETELRWLQRHQEQIGARYAGEWIAVTGGQVVAHAVDLLALKEQVRAAGQARPLVLRVPVQRDATLHG